MTLPKKNQKKKDGTRQLMAILIKLKHTQFTQRERNTISSFQQELSEHKGKKGGSQKSTNLKSDLTDHQSMGVKQHVGKQSLASSFKPCSVKIPTALLVYLLLH